MAKPTTSANFDIDMFMDETGNFGRFEILTYALLSISIIHCAYTTFIYSFSAAIINHRCLIPECENKKKAIYEPKWIKRTMNFEVDVVCERYNLTEKARMLKPKANSSCPKEWFNKKQKIKCKKNELVFQFSDHTYMHEADLECDDSKLLGLVGTLHNTGQAIGFPTLGILSDKFGRKPVLIISIIATIHFGALHLLCDRYSDFLICEVLMGFWVAGIYNSAYVLAVELVGKKARVFGGVLISTFYTMGVTFLGVCAMFIKDWEIYYYIELPFAICIAYCWLCIESTRWLNIQGKEVLLKKKLILIAKIKGHKYTEDDLEKFRVKGKTQSLTSAGGEGESSPQTEDTKPIDETANETQQNEAPENDKKGTSRFQKLIHSRVLLLRLVNCYFCWITNALVYVGLQLAAVSIFGDRHINWIVSGLVEIPAYIITPFLADYIGRRNTLCLSLLICGGCSLAYPFLSQHIAGTIVYFIAKLGITISYAVVYVFTAELFPTELRHTLVGTCSMFSRIGAITAPQWRLLNNYVKGLPFYIFAATCLSSAFLILLVPETLKQKLPDTVDEAENLKWKLCKS